MWRICAIEDDNKRRGGTGYTGSGVRRIEKNNLLDQIGGVGSFMQTDNASNGSLEHVNWELGLKSN